MDIDAVPHARNSPFIHFFDVSSGFPWHEARREQIRLRRAHMDDTLIFDILLTSGGIGDPYHLYPPEHPEALERLLDAIESSNYDALKKDCLVYFLLKWHQDKREREFQEQRCIPPQFVALADAYWHLDSAINIPRAVALLSDARLNRDYASKIIRAIYLSPDSAPLIRQYIQTAKPLLVEPPDIECYALALADSSVLESWQFSRTFNEEDVTRTRLLQKILEWTVTPAPRPVALTQLIALPLSPFEEQVLNDFVQKPPSTMVIKFSSIAILQDLICVRLIQGGRYTEAIKLDKLFSSTTPPKYLKDTRDRSKMVQEVYLALPMVEKALIDAELDPAFAEAPPLAPKTVSQETRRPPAATTEPLDTSLSQSWEEVHVPEALVAKPTPLRDVRVPITPRFGTNPSVPLTTPVGLPILPINFNGIASGSNLTPRKSLPLSASVLGSSKARTSLSGVGNRMSFGTQSAIASPASGMKLPTSSHGPGHAFVSASKQQNAFYQPAAKTNGVKRAFEEEINKSPEHVDKPENAVDVDMDAEDDSPEQAPKRGRKSNARVTTDGEGEGTLQYSVFGEKSKNGSAKKNEKVEAPPGAFGSDMEETMDEDREEVADKRLSSGARATRTTRASKAQPAPAPTKPPAKKARKSKEKALSRSIPGGLMDEDDDEEENEEEDHIAPLPTSKTSRARPVRKARSSASVDTTDEMDGIQTRRRSSRLTTGGSGSVHSGGSPEPAAAPKTRKSGRASAAKKKR